MHSKLTASIVIYKNDPEILAKAVSSFLNSTREATLYLIDNSPTNMVKDRFTNPRVKYIFNNRNVGFGAGHNIALKEIIAEEKSSYHIVMNPDVYFASDVVEKILKFMDENPAVGLTMPKVLHPDGRLQPLCKLLPSPVTLFSRRFLTFSPVWVNKLNHEYEMHFSGYDKIMDVPFLSGCFMFLRMDALKKVGLFDERIFLYTEDTDLTRRIHQYFRTIFYPEACIFHSNERASYKNTFILLHHIRSAITYFNKWGWFNDTERKVINEQVLLKLLR
jgi:GT2 family glycosyltransferase